MLQNDCFLFHDCFSFRDCFSFDDCFFFHFWKWISQEMESYFSLLNLSFVENCHISISTTFAKQSTINRLSNAINRIRSAAKISKVMSSNAHTWKVEKANSSRRRLRAPGAAGLMGMNKIA